MNISKRLPENLKNKLPITYKIIESGNLLIDNRVKAVFISGSSGLIIDLSFISEGRHSGRRRLLPCRKNRGARL